VAKLPFLVVASCWLAWLAPGPAPAQESVPGGVCRCLADAARELRPGEEIGLLLRDGSSLRGRLQGIDTLGGRVGLLVPGIDLEPPSTVTVDGGRIARLERWARPHHSAAGAAVGLGLLGGLLGARIGVSLGDNEGWERLDNGVAGLGIGLFVGVAAGILLAAHADDGPPRVADTWSCTPDAAPANPR